MLFEKEILRNYELCAQIPTYIHVLAFLMMIMYEKLSNNTIDIFIPNN